MKNALKVIVLFAVASVLVGCSKSEPLDASNDPPKGGKAMKMNSADAPAASKPQGAKAESQ